MSADLDRLLGELSKQSDMLRVSGDTIRRIVTEFAQVVRQRDELRGLVEDERYRAAKMEAERDEARALADDRDRWRAIANRLGKAMCEVWDAGYFDEVSGSEWAEIDLAIGEWQSAKEVAPSPRLEEGPAGL